ncbi:MAG TPA: helix-turn-helix domain-containing protein [Bryobacteraceae bacterium]|nr:helix-turn-helix domain-containing protein [Bryobacteraceae bacterium]
MKARPEEDIARYADMFAAMGSEQRLRILRLLLAAHPGGLVVGEIQEETEITGSNLSHHLEKLKNEGLVQVKREGTFLRYTANTGALQQLLGFLYAECCTRSAAIKPAIAAVGRVDNPRTDCQSVPASEARPLVRTRPSGRRQANSPQRTSWNSKK